jgi:cyanate lyase
MTTKQEAAEAVRGSKARLGLTWTQIAEAIGRPVAWTTAALLGQHPLGADEANTAASLLDLDERIASKQLAMSVSTSHPHPLQDSSIST